MEQPQQTAFEELGPIPSSKPTAAPLRKSVPSAVKRMILELGLRYRPAAQDALEGHQAKLAALMLDLADLPPDYLERAIEKWVTEQRWMPAASDLIGIAKSFMPSPQNLGERVDVISGYNARLRAQGRHFQWAEDDLGNLKLETL